MLPQVIFNKPFFSYLAPVAFLITFVFSLATQRFNQRLVAQWGKRKTLEGHSNLKSKRMRGTFWLALSISFLLLALAEPVLPNSDQTVGKAFSFVVVLDVSRSMGAEDYPDETSRIEMARRCLLDLYEAYPKGSAGFVRPTDQASSWMVTTDRKVLKYLTLHETNLNKVKGEGSRPDRGLGVAVGLIRKSPQEIRTIIFLSDGGNDAPIKLRETIPLLVGDGVRVISVGLGGDRPVKIPNRDPETGEIIGFHRLHHLHGAYATTKFDKRPLVALAEATGGDYVRIKNGDELAQVVSKSNYATDIIAETGEGSLVKYPLTAMLVILLVWVVDKRFFQR